LSPDFNALLYADDIVPFFSNKYLDRSIDILNNALKILFTSLSVAYFSTAPEKSHFMIFTRRKIAGHPHIVLDNQIIVPSRSVTYLGLKLDPKLRWVSNVNHLRGMSCWSNFLHTTIGLSWGFHPSYLLKIFNAVIRSKADYGSFLFAFSSFTHLKKN